MARTRRKRALNPYQANADTGLIKILAFVVAIVLVVSSGWLDCRFEFIPLGFC